MKTLILSAVAVAALTGAASAELFNEATGMTVERRTTPQGNSYWVYVRPAQQTTTVAVYRGGQSRQVVRAERMTKATHRDDAHGRTSTTYRTTR